MPKTSMDENHLAPAWKDEIGFSGKPCIVQAISKSERVHETADYQLGFHISAADARHVDASAFGSQFVRHEFNYIWRAAETERHAARNL